MTHVTVVNATSNYYYVNVGENDDKDFYYDYQYMKHHFDYPKNENIQLKFAFF